MTINFRGALAILAAMTLAGCASPATPGSNSPKGEVHGRILGNGGPTPQTHVMPGTVTATLSGHTVSTQHVADGSGFSFTLPAGRYVLKADDDSGLCTPATVAVTSGGSVTADINCNIK